LVRKKEARCEQKEGLMRECQAITTLRFRGVNGYLVKTGDGGYVLIDTGFSSKRAAIKHALAHAGCTPGTLRLIVLTHGDADHVGNAAALRATYSTPIALHRGEVGAVESGNPALNKQVRQNLTGILVRLILRFFRLSPSDRFTPDVYLEEGDNLRAYGFNAQVLHLPGHSYGSIGVLTESGDLFCGDLLRNGSKPAPGLGMFDQVGFQASIEKLKRVHITTVYPGHGKPFPLEAFLKSPG
jgi:hydroxyacylglutathione hydrolase